MERAARIEGLDISLIRQIAEGARPSAIPLGIGEPTWDLPEPAQRILREWSGRAPYGAGTGLPELRKAIADYYSVSFDDVVITQGSIGGLFALLQAWVGPGDKVLLPDPGFVTYPNLVRFAQAEPAYYPLDERLGFRLNASEILTRFDLPGVKAVIVNHPSNPTGAGCQINELRLVAEACRERGMLLISDEVYRDLYFSTRTPGLRDVSPYGVVVSSVSKGWGAPGLRVGWMVGNPELLAPARTVHSYATTSPSYVAQKAALALVKESEEIHRAARRELAERWNALKSAKRSYFGSDDEPPDGSFYHFMRLPEAATNDPVGFALKIRDEADVVVIPGLAFGERGRAYVRISFAANPDQIVEGIRRLATYWQ